jgi:signal peptidase I
VAQANTGGLSNADHALAKRMITATRHRNIKGKHVLLALVMVALVFKLVRNCIGTIAVIEGDSMSPTFRPNDFVCARALYAGPARGDVVILTDDRGDRVIKRIVGLPHETVTICRGFVYIDTQRISEPYLPKRTYTFKRDEIIGLPPQWRLGDDEYFVLGDNRLRSHDSRNFGAVVRNHIHGLVSHPGKEQKPEFCGIMLIRSGNMTSVKFTPRQDHTSHTLPASNIKI